MAITLGVQFVEESCCQCGVLFAMTVDYKNRMRELAETRNFYCPNGHSQHYCGKSYDQQIADLRLTVQQRDNLLSDERKSRERLERRVRQGVCLYCKRTFSNLAQHMACKHKDKK